MRYRDLELDPFQADAITQLDAGRSVLVCAPTGTGKTVIADWIVERAIATGRQVVYTAPVKALSNQKFRDYTRLHGEANVGLVTGDLVIRHGAPCRVMTTEILRNILLSDDEIGDLMAVILDEIHFLDDRERGTVWEEVLIYLPPEVQVIGLSATLSNLRDFAAWMEHVRGSRVAVIQEHDRAVPLRFHYATRESGLLAPERFDEHWRRTHHPPPARERRGKRGRPRRAKHAPRRRITRHLDVIRMARDADLLPCLYFAFSRKNTEGFARALARWLDRPLVDVEERRQLDARLRAVAGELGPILDPELRRLYEHGVAFHHAGLHVRLKSLVEELYEARLIKVLYCTSTFALGINMPARSVVFDGVKKYDGRSIAPLTTRQFMQKAGRAGRRGMDEVGHVIVRIEPDRYDELRKLLARYRQGAYEPVRSSFSLSWNSVVNLLGRHDEARIREIVEKSFLNWHLAHQAGKNLARAEQLERGSSSKQRSEAGRLRRRARRVGERCWSDYLAKVGYLQAIGYLDEERGFNAGARVLSHLQISEIAVTELVLSGLLEELDPPSLFGVLCAVVTDLPRGTERGFRFTRADWHLASSAEAICTSELVLGAAELAHTELVWCPDLIPLGRAWARGASLQEILMGLESATDISGDLISSFRRARDLAGQLADVYADLPERVEVLRKLIREVGRDDVEVVG